MEENNVKHHNALFHEKTKSFQCDLCKKTFTTNHYTQTHMALAHEGKKSLCYCNSCDKSFAEKRHLETHITSVHKRLNFFM